VLISMGILTVGLLGVAALFPVGGFYMQKAEIADRASAVAQAVMSDIVARGMLNPSAWYAMVPTPRVGVKGVWNTGFTADSKYTPAPPVPPPARPATFSRPVVETLAEALQQSQVITDATLINKQFGAAFVLDPLGVAALAFPDGRVPPQPIAHGPASTFPATGYTSLGYYSWGNSPWNAWIGNNKNGFLWPVRRVTFRHPAAGWQMNPTIAEHYFRGNDDLASDLPDRDDRPARQNWDIVDTGGGNLLPLARQWAGDYSWIVTVAPTTNAARDGLARNPEGYVYDVSVVVFYKRVLPVDVESIYQTTGGLLPDFLRSVGENERAVRAAVVSTGLNGGEMLLTDWGDNPAKSPFADLKNGQWVMLCGPHPNSTASESRFFLNWYQVLSIDTEGTGIPNFDPATQRVVALRGPEWPWTPQSDLDTYSIPNYLCVAICRGAVAVHTKTMRLESPRSSPVRFGGAGNSESDGSRWGWD
jgi:hypothetical protein